MIGGEHWEAAAPRIPRYYNIGGLDGGGGEIQRVNRKRYRCVCRRQIYRVGISVAIACPESIPTLSVVYGRYECNNNRQLQHAPPVDGMGPFRKK